MSKCVATSKLMLVTMVSVLASITALCQEAQTAAAPSNVTGFWVFRVPTGDGNFRESFFDLKQEGDTISGEFIQGSRKLPISDGFYRDGKLHWIVNVRGGNPPQDRQVVYDGTILGKNFQLTSQFPGRNPITGSLEPSKPEAALPPPRLPLPELHDVADNSLVRTPPMGWNSWNKFAGKVDDAAVRGVADAMVASGMKDAGYIYINIDDTWEGPRDANGNITSNLKFPDMKALAEYVHSKGLKIGIYSSPGPKTCAGYEGRRVAEDGPSDRLQPVPVRPQRRVEVGREGRGEPLAHYRRHQRSLAIHGPDRLPAVRDRPLRSARSL